MKIKEAALLLSAIFVIDAKQVNAQNAKKSKTSKTSSPVSKTPVKPTIGTRPLTAAGISRGGWDRN